MWGKKYTNLTEESKKIYYRLNILPRRTRMALGIHLCSFRRKQQRNSGFKMCQENTAFKLFDDSKKGEIWSSITND